MSFSFNFQYSSEDDSADILHLQATKDNTAVLHSSSQTAQEIYTQPCKEFPIFIPEQSSLLFNSVSYGPDKSNLVYKRNLSDVKMQLAMEDEVVLPPAGVASLGDNISANSVSADDLRFDKLSLTSALDSNTVDSDLIKGLYEGGFKTWECSVDLINYLSENFKGRDLENKRVLELGCGSSLPSLHILKSTKSTVVHLQDYNSHVINYISIPNVVANTCLVPYLPVRSNDKGVNVDNIGDNGEDEDNITQDPYIEIDLDELRGAALFNSLEKKSTDTSDDTEKKSMLEYYELSDQEVGKANDILLSGASLKHGLPDSQSVPIKQRTKFFSGSWDSFTRYRAQSQELSNVKYDIIFTSETIYDLDSQHSLYNCFVESLAKPVDKPIDTNSVETSHSNDSFCHVHEPAIYVAAKSVYFGLSGSILSFRQFVEAKNEFKVETVWKSSGGLQREVLKMTWL